MPSCYIREARATTPGPRLSLASGFSWGFEAYGAEAARVLRLVARTARLRASDAKADRLLVLHDRGLVPASQPDEHGDRFELTGDHRIDVPRACCLLAARTPGAVLVHGSLVAKDGRAVLLAGPGGRGKTTSSKRLPATWEALSDDAALVLPNAEGRYVGHPWPTWSRVLWEGSTDAWNVERWVPLEHIFFLARAEVDSVERVGRSQALCLLLESVEQLRGRLRPEHRSAAVRLQGLETASDIVKSVPVSVLHLSPAGPFWLAIEEALARGRARP